MYTRSERVINFAKNNNPNIGPGTYQKTEEYENTKTQGYAPFSSLQPRLTLFNEAGSNPSPNEYNTAPIPLDRAGRVVPFGRSNRFSYPKYVSPGPATYNVRQKIGSEIEKIGPKIGRLAMNNVGYGYTPRIDYVALSDMVKDNEENNETKKKNINFVKKGINSMMDLDEDVDKDKNIIVQAFYKPNGNNSKKNDNIERCNLIWKRKFVTPSIPYKNMTYGFIENQDGDIVPRKPPQNDDTIGPAYYNITNNSVQSNNVYRGGFTFGNSIKEREAFKVNKDIPGPGKYNITNNIEPKKRNNATNLMKYAPNTRFSEAITNEEIKKNIPGPGAYKTDITSKPKTSKKKELFLFGGKQDRFSTINTLSNVQKSIKDNCAPGPGAYDIEHPSDEYDSINYIYRNNKGKTSLGKEDRFKDNFENRSMPGPGQYNVKYDFDPKIYHNVPSTKTYGFGTTSKRFPTSKVSSNPGPGQYNYVGDSFNKTLSSIKEGLELDDGGKLKTGVIINKNANDLSKIKSRKPMKYKPSNKTNEDESVKIGFGSQHDRFSKAGQPNNPAPGMYDSSAAFNMLKSHGKLGLTLKSRFGLKFNNNRLPPGLYDPSLPERKNFHAPVHDYSYMGKSERFDYKDNKIPGPSDYLSPRYDGGLIKKSFNITLKDKEILK